MNPTGPTESGLVLQTATANPQQQVLTARAVYDIYNVQGQIAYLSGCSTAEAQALRLIDEQLHVASSF